MPSLVTPRHTRPSTRRTALLALTGVALAAASAAPPLHSDDTVPVTLAFAGEFGGQPFDCAARFDDIGASAASVTVADYRLYVSRVRLLDADGGETPLIMDEDGRWQGEGVALLDFEDATGHCSNGTPPTNATVTGRAPAGDYTGVAFDIGVPFELNHGDPTLAGSPLNLTGMFWNWRGGYRFMRVDLAGVTDTAAADPMAADMRHGSADMPGQAMDGDTMEDMAAGGDRAAGGHGGAHGGGHSGAWMLHVGSTGCVAATPTTAPSTCAEPNRIAVVLEDFEADTDTLVIDPARALADVDVSRNTPDTAPGCMSSPDDPECAPVLDTLGLGAGDRAQTLVTVR